jgi:sulfofructose kinase
MAMSSPGVACIGLATADTVVSLPGWPSADGRMLADVIVRSFGGPAATAAVTIARLGHRAAMIGAVGDDDPGIAVRDSLAAAGVDVAGLATMPGRTAESVILLDRSANTRTILHAAGVSLPTLDDAALASCADAAWVHVDHGGYGLARMLDRGTLSVDAGHRIDALEIGGLGLYAPSRSALLDRYPGHGVGAAMREALREGASRVAVTLGADGAVAANADGAWAVAAPEIEVVSTLGAGDVFHGALLASLLDGRSLPDALRRAVVAAALSCRALDGRGGIPDAVELDTAVGAAPAVESVLLEDLA